MAELYKNSAKSDEFYSLPKAVNAKSPCINGVLPVNLYIQKPKKTVMPEKSRAELLFDHYKDTYHYVYDQLKRRNRFFLALLTLLSLMTLDMYSPELLPQMTNAYLAKTLGTPQNPAPTFDFSVIGSTFWFILLSLTIQYYQRSIQIDRRYNYLQNLERQICKDMGEGVITREGSAYWSETGVSGPGLRGDHRPLFLRSVGPLYVYFFPLVLTILIVAKLVREDLPPLKTTDLFNLTVGGVIVIYNLLYVIWVKFRK